MSGTQEEILRSRGLHYGDGVFRTLLVWDGEPVDLDGQLARLAADCARLGLSAPSRARVRAALRRALADGSPRAVLKLLAWRAGRARGYAPMGASCSLAALAYPLPSYPSRCWSRGIHVARSPVLLSEQPLLAGIKHLNRLESVLASRAWAGGVSEVILCDARQRPVCGSRSNLFWVRRGILYTPDLTRCGVAGRMRERVLALAPQAGLRVETGAFGWRALRAAEEVFVTNSVIGLWSVRRIDADKGVERGPLARRLLDLLAHPYRGRD